MIITDLPRARRRYNYENVFPKFAFPSCSVSQYENNDVNLPTPFVVAGRFYDKLLCCEGLPNTCTVEQTKHVLRAILINGRQDKFLVNIEKLRPHVVCVYPIPDNIGTTSIINYENAGVMVIFNGRLFRVVDPNSVYRYIDRC